MVKRCCWGTCNTDSRFPERMEGGITFFPFPKPHSKLQRCKLWIKLCGRPKYQLNEEVLRCPSKGKHFYVCSKHFKDGQPTDLHPDPESALPFDKPTHGRPLPRRRHLNFDAQQSSISVPEAEIISVEIPLEASSNTASSSNDCEEQQPAGDQPSQMEVDRSASGDALTDYFIVMNHGVLRKVLPNATLISTREKKWIPLKPVIAKDKTFNQSSQQEMTTEKHGQQISSGTKEYELFNKTHILVNAYMRSGSTFLSSIFNKHPNVFYVHEPLWQFTMMGYFTANNTLCDSVTPHCWTDNERPRLANSTIPFIRTGELQVDAMLRALRNFYKCNFDDPNFDRVIDFVDAMSASYNYRGWLKYFDCKKKHRKENIARCLPILKQDCQTFPIIVTKGIPYVGPIPGGLQDGMQIHVSGTPEHHHNGFLISLQCGGSIDPRSECALAFNPRFTDNQVVRNSLQGGAWGQEERHGGFPFNRGQHCDVTIHVKPGHFSVTVNGRHFCYYNHRIQKHRVTHITVEQGIRVNTIRFEHAHGGGHHHGGHPHHGMGIGAALGHFAGAVLGQMVNQPHQPYPGGSGYPAPSGTPMYNPPVPFVTNVGGLYPNKMIFISGIPHPNPSRFTIYIQQGSHFEPHEVAMCFDARFMYNTDRNTVVCNHKQGNWGSEQRSAPYFPFSPNTNFDIIILVEHSGFKVAVNNQHLLEFHHRLQPMHRADTLRIDGDVRLTQFRFQ